MGVATYQSPYYLLMWPPGWIYELRELRSQEAYYYDDP